MAPGRPPRPQPGTDSAGRSGSRTPRASRGPCAAPARLGDLLCSRGDSAAGRILRQARNYSTQRAPRHRRGRRGESVSAMSRQARPGFPLAQKFLESRTVGRVGKGREAAERSPGCVGCFYFIRQTVISRAEGGGLQGLCKGGFCLHIP